MLVYIDDILFFGNSQLLIDEAKAALQRQLKIKDLGEVKYFLGMEIFRSAKGFILTQRKHTLEVLQDIGLSGAKPAITPIEQNMKLTIYDFDIALKQKKNQVTWMTSY